MNVKLGYTELPPTNTIPNNPSLNTLEIIQDTTKSNYIHYYVRDKN